MSNEQGHAASTFTHSCIDIPSLLCYTVNESEVSQKMKKALCMISNILLSILYVPASVFPSIIGFMLLVYGRWGWSYDAVIGVLCCAILLLTPLFAILGMILSVIYRKRENYSSAFLVQFLPFGTIGFCVVIGFLAGIGEVL